MSARDSTDVKMCPECLRDKPIAGGFYRNGATFDGLDRICRECMNRRFKDPSTLGSREDRLANALRGDARRRQNIDDRVSGIRIESLVFVFQQLERLAGGK